MAHTTVSSIYSAVEDVPLILAPQFSALQPIALPHAFNLELPLVKNYDFQLERHIIAESERYRQENATETQLRAQKLQALQEERIRKQKEEARKIAPGFLDTNLRILTPVPVNNTQRRASQQTESAVNEKNTDEQKAHARSASDDTSVHIIERIKKSKEEGDETKPAKSLVYLEFEESLSQNSWDQPNTIQDDMSILQEVIGSHTNSSSEINNLVANGDVTGSPNFLGAPANHDIMVTNPNHPRSFHPSPLLQPSVGAPLPSQLSNQSFSSGSSITHDLLSNNLANLQISQNNYSTSPINIHNNTSSSVKSYSAPSSNQERRPLHQPYSTPPIPPKEELPLSSSSPKNEESDNNNDNSDLIKELGFTKEQAIDALEKYDHDLQKATNYLLDNTTKYM